MPNRVQVDVLLTDFNQWLACVYMAESVRSLPDDMQQLIEVKKWDMRTLEGVQRFQELRAKSLPSIALDGELVYEASIPAQEELCDAILRRSRDKGNGTPLASR